MQGLDVQELVNDLDELLGVGGNFWALEQPRKLTLNAPEELENLFRDLLVDTFGMEVQGL